MLKALENLKLTKLFPNLHHVTCIAHALNRVCCVISEENVEINLLISLFKKVMVKSPLREHSFQIQTGLPLSPKAVKTRWNS